MKEEIIIESSWGVEDILDMDNSLSKTECIKVLEEVEHRVDKADGINDIIREIINDVIYDLKTKQI